jgi:hypothetical protein
MISKATSRIAHWGRLLFLPCFGCSPSLLPVNNILFPILGAIFLLLFASSGHATPITLSSDAEIATAGYYQLNWAGKGGQYRLEESSTADFTTYQTLYQGHDLATVISGKSDGIYYYRISMGTEQAVTFSNTVKVTVTHHSLRNAILFFIAGATVFLATFILIIKGNQLQTTK